MIVAHFFLTYSGEEQAQDAFIGTDERDLFVEDMAKAKRFKDQPEAEEWVAHLIETAGLMERLRDFAGWQVAYEDADGPLP